MDNTTYGEVFEFDIRNILNEGDLSRRELFEWWLGKGAVLSCARCGEEFTPRGDADEDQEILCERCRKRRKR